MDNGQQVIRLLDTKHMVFLFVSLFLIIIGSRAAVINYSGSFTPFLDEWDGDAAGLLKPYIRADLTIRDLFSPFNEHIILFTRLLVLAIFHISGYWDVILQMVVNAALDAATIVGISYALSRVLGGAWAVALMVISTLINAIPLSYESILMAFNTHFYLLLAFSFASLWYLTDSQAWSPRWALGVLCAVASFLCMASGALTLAAAIGLHVSQTACGRRGGVREWLGIAALAAATFILMSLVPHVAESDPYRAHSLREFLSKLLELANLACRSHIRMANRFAFCAILPADVRGSSTIDRSEMVQCRCVRMDSDTIPCSRGGPRGDADCEPLFRYAADRGSDKPDKYFLAVGVAPDRREAETVAAPGPSGMAGPRGSFVGAFGAPPPRVP
jgi:hypothetical protein